MRTIFDDEKIVLFCECCERIHVRGDAEGVLDEEGLCLRGEVFFERGDIDREGVGIGVYVDRDASSPTNAVGYGYTGECLEQDVASGGNVKGLNDSGECRSTAFEGGCLRTKKSSDCSFEVCDGSTALPCPRLREQGRGETHIIRFRVWGEGGYEALHTVGAGARCMMARH